MKTKTPRTLSDYREYLESAFDILESDHASDFFDQMQIANQVEEASTLACRFGMGDLIDPQHHIMTPRQALVVVGRLLARAEKELRSPTLDIHEIALILGCTERTVWRWEAKGLIPAARRVGRLVRWDRDEVDTWLEKQATLN